jgi:hypothetical protein
VGFGFRFALFCAADDHLEADAASVPKPLNKRCYRPTLATRVMRVPTNLVLPSCGNEPLIAHGVAMVGRL